MTSPVSYEIVNNVGVITIDNQPVNALSQPVRQGLSDTITNAQSDASKILLIRCVGRTFIAGADITEFGKPPKGPFLPDVLQQIEDSSKPVVAAIHGTALGGGFETALACHYRCAIASAKVGLPEVKLGLLPGAGGTQRVPRLAGIRAAMDLMTSGLPVNMRAAEEMQLVDRVFQEDLDQNAIAWCRELLESGAVCRKTSALPVEQIADNVFADYRDKLAKKARGQFAPQQIVDCVEAAMRLPFVEGLATERAKFLECKENPQSIAMQHLFFAERKAAKIDGIGKDTPKRDIQRVAVIGGGTMGTGIAMNFASAGFEVVLLEISDEALEKGLAIIARNYAGGVKRGKMTEQGAFERRGRIRGSTDYGSLADADLVVEAVFEDLSLKQKIFGRLDEVCKPGAILATNTSYQDVNKIAAATNRPEDVIGLHFFSPAHIMKLLEVVRADKTANDVLASCMAVARKIGKTPVVAGVCYGFVGNRMFRAYIREAMLCLLEGSSPQSVDAAMQQWGMAMGPISVSDLAGLDISYTARKTIALELLGDPRTFRVSDALVEMGRMGQKSGAGYYNYDAQTRQKTSDPDVQAIIEREAAAVGITRRDIAADEIVDRLLYAMVNEGINIIDEGIAQRASDIDVVYTFGYGFPAYRGGPMHYAESIGLEKVLDRIRGFQANLSKENWTPAPLLERLVKEGKTLAEVSS